MTKRPAEYDGRGFPGPHKAPTLGTSDVRSWLNEFDSWRTVIDKLCLWHCLQQWHGQRIMVMDDHDYVLFTGRCVFTREHDPDGNLWVVVKNGLEFMWLKVDFLWTVTYGVLKVLICLEGGDCLERSAVILSLRENLGLCLRVRKDLARLWQKDAVTLPLVLETLVVDYLMPGEEPSVLRGIHCGHWLRLH